MFPVKYRDYRKKTQKIQLKLNITYVLDLVFCFEILRETNDTSVAVRKLSNYLKGKFAKDFFVFC